MTPTDTPHRHTAPSTVPSQVHTPVPRHLPTPIPEESLCSVGLAPLFPPSTPTISWDKTWQLSPTLSKASESGRDAQFQPSLLQALDSGPEALGQG